MAVLSAVAGGLAAALLAQAALWALPSRGISAWAASCGALLVGFSPLVLRWSSTAEVFALHLCLSCGLLAVAASFHGATVARQGLFAAFVAGLALAHHQTSLAVVLPVAALWLAQCRRQATKAPFGWALMLGAVGLLPYLALVPLGERAATGSWAVLDGLSEWVGHVLRRDYGTFQLAQEGARPGVGATTFAWVARASDELTWVGLPLALTGALWALWPRPAEHLRPARALAATAAGAMVLALPAFSALANLPIHDPLLREVLARFWLLPLALAGLFAAFGAFVVLQRLPRHQHTLGVVGLVAVLTWGGWHTLAARRALPAHAAVEALGLHVLRPVWPGALLLTRGDLPTNAVGALQSLEGARADVAHADQLLLTRASSAKAQQRAAPHIPWPAPLYGAHGEGSFLLSGLLDALGAQRPLFVYPDPHPDDPSARALTQTRVGLPAWIHRGERGPKLAELVVRAADRLPLGPSEEWHRAPEGTWERAALADLWMGRHNAASHLLEWPVTPQSPPTLVVGPLDLLEPLPALHPTPPASVYKNLALAADRAARVDPARGARALEYLRAYVERASADDPQRAQALGILAGARK
jgi:hypothetical protein